ncbi:transmembrane protein 267 [Nymphalis io]|uniref:transmembrane protein 267 n=1 Tax=Inachis io TaxID=171585 RepID=UPI002169BAEA|nr:transmembrane protein 267 [Nymphalis io]
MKSLRLLLVISIGVTAYLGDYIVFKSKYSGSLLFRALADSSVHGAIGFLSALSFFSNIKITSQACIYNTIFCTFMSSVIDVDHFFVARSIYLKDLTNISQRGILHCTTFWMMVTSILALYSHLTHKINVYIVTYMLVLAFTSHHLRDGNRRGIWLCPLGHTMPVNKFLYVILICILPTLFAYLFNYTKPMFKHTVFNYIEL